jgi:hypothetical protein
MAVSYQGERFPLVFIFVPDLRRIIRQEEISRVFLGKGKKSIDLESVVTVKKIKKIRVCCV